MVRLRLDLGYDGTDFSGWAKQPGFRTVQGEIESALAKILRLPEPPVLTVAGRTDAGVHARHQVAHLDMDAELLAELDRNRYGSGAEPGNIDERLSSLVRRLAGVMPPDVRVHRVTVAPEGFDARFSALFRRYCYRVTDAVGGGDPLHRHDVYWHSRPLDIDALNAAAVHLLGEHDFAAFCKKRVGATTIRELQRLDWVRDSEGVLTATVVADAFCHSMVRALVGALLSVGDGRQAVEWPGEVLSAAVRDSRLNVAPARGLCLEEVGYPADIELAGRARATRRVRTLGGGTAPSLPDVECR